MSQKHPKILPETEFLHSTLTKVKAKERWNLPHSGGNASLGDLLSVNSVPRIKPVPRIWK